MAKYTQAQIEKLGKEGKAFKNPDGHYSYPIADVDDLSRAIKAVGRSSASHAAVRRYIIGRAKAFGKANVIPHGWTSIPGVGRSAPVETERCEHRLPRKGDREVRTVPFEWRETATPLETEDGRQLLRFSGHASVFNRRYQVGSFKEQVLPGAFRRSLNNPDLDTVLRTEHGDLPIARTTGTVTLADGTSRPTLALSEDSIGLRADALLDAEDPDVMRLVPKLRRGDLREMSFAFRCFDDEWSEGLTRRDVKGAEIHRGDVSIVTYGASDLTTASVRSRYRGPTSRPSLDRLAIARAEIAVLSLNRP